MGFVHIGVEKIRFIRRNERYIMLIGEIDKRAFC